VNIGEIQVYFVDINTRRRNILASIIFAPNMEAFLFTILQMFIAIITYAGSELFNIAMIFPSFSFSFSM